MTRTINGLGFLVCFFIIIRDFFEDHVGPCSFDFIKLSPDQLKLFVAVRFETRDAAKECMHKYKDGDVLGFPVEMTWFRDIRRFMSYQQSQGLRAAASRNRYNNRGYNGRNSYERSSRNDYRDDDYDRGSKRKRTESDDRRSDSKRSRSRSNSSSRSRSPSPRHSSRDRSRTPDSRRSDGSPRHSRSNSRRSSGSPPPRDRSTSPPNAPSPPSQQQKRIVEVIEKGSTPPLPPSPAPASSVVTKTAPEEPPAEEKSPARSHSPSPAPERKSRKSKKDKKKKRRRSPSSSSSTSSEGDQSTDELSEGELRKKILKKRQKALREDVSEEQASKTNGKPLGKWEEKEAPGIASRPESSLLQNTTLKFGLESTEDIPKRIVKDSQASTQMKKFSPSQVGATVAVPSVTPESSDLRNSPPLLPARLAKAEAQLSDGISGSGLSKKSSAGIMDKMGKMDTRSLFSTDIDSLLGKRSSAQSSGNSSMLDQANVFSTMRSQQPQVNMRAMLDDNDEPPAGSLRLSSFTRQLNAESERERKLARLPPEALAKFVAKKKQFDATLKADCETFAFVTKTLIQKDPTLEDRLRLALAEAIKDMEDSFTQKIDQYLDQLIMFISM